MLLYHLEVILYSSLHLFVARNKHFTYVAAGLWVPLRPAVLRGSVDGAGKGDFGVCCTILHVSADTRELYPGLGAQEDGK